MSMQKLCEVNCLLLNFLKQSTCTSAEKGASMVKLGKDDNPKPQFGTDFMLKN